MRNLSSGFLNMSDTNQAVQSQKIARGWKYRISEVEKTKALLSCRITVQLICGFVFRYSKSRISHGEAQIILDILTWPLASLCS